MGWLIYGTKNYKIPFCLWELNLPFVDVLLPEKSISNSERTGFLILFLSWLISIFPTMQIPVKIQEVSYRFIRPLHCPLLIFPFQKNPPQKRRFWPAKMPKKFWSFVPGRKGSRYIAWRSTNGNEMRSNVF